MVNPYHLYSTSFTQNETTGKYEVNISASELDYDGSLDFGVIKVTRRNAENKWKNVLFSYEINTDGSLKLIFDETFRGKVTILEDVTG